MKYFLPTARYTRRTRTEAVVIHSAYTRKNQDFTVADVRKWHVDENGWMDVGYHFIIRRDGTLEIGRPLWAVGAHVTGVNSTTVGICMMGGKHETANKWADDSEANFTPEQMRTLAALVRMLKEVYPTAGVKAHRDYPGVRASGKLCPAFDVPAWHTRTF